MMNEPLEEEYLSWLSSCVGRRGRTEGHLLSILHHTEFTWRVLNDDNRAEDGRDLRLKFVEEVHSGDIPDEEWIDLPCSVLEMLIALCNRMEYNDYKQRPSSDWFWILIRNLDLDRIRTTHDERADRILENFLNRAYSRDGRGGLFPIVNEQEDQRTVEIWDQMSAYLLQN